MKARGMTLLELLVVVTVVAILSAIAVPSYRSYVLRVNRTDAKTALTGAAQRLERCFTRFNAYDNAGCTLAVPYDVPQGGGTPTYTVSGVFNANSFVLTATRRNGQVDDAACGDFQINEQGQQMIVGGTRTAVDCWR